MTFKQFASWGAGTLAVSTALLLAGSGAATAAPATAQPAPECPADGGMPGIGNEPTFTDNNVALFAGGDYTATGGSAEAEGLLVVKGDAEFDKASGGVYNVGRVGVGSGIHPTPGQAMLTVGGDMAVGEGTTVDVGHAVSSGSGSGGAVRVGGTLDERGTLETNGGDLRTGIGAQEALGPFRGFAATLSSQSGELGALEPTGTAERNGARVTFTSTGGGGLQVFEIAAADLDGASEFVFDASLPEDAAVLVNVEGGDAVSIDPLYTSYKGERVDGYGSALFGEAASRILYNFTDAPSVSLGSGGSFMGSVLAPEASADITASTNGRLYFGGDVTTHGSGNESHNYPWTGAPEFDCEPGTPTPEEPDGSEEPNEPEPTEPGETAEPETPDETGEPNEPGEPSTPAEPGNPDEQNKPDGSEGSDSDGGLPVTGSDLGLLVAGAVALIGAGGAALVAARKRRKA
ncbi:choice-of-anchor A family protein [Nocardiopsis halophila]|uniref:choice-of-anchor A family protein n=1 Tax=Nocardiopsis halophila TaxID=141692 RepID=UPI00034B3F6D|nr:choice-of-anchor A family protein [Nocardiopsis halophila]